MKHLFVLNDPPYGTERSYNGLRLARELLKNPASGNEVRVFLLGDGVACAKANQRVPAGYYHLESFIKTIVRAGADVGLCGSCLDARGITEAEIIEGTRRGSMAQLAEWTQWADKVLVF
jgi:uncharacterized protein involved in oxidation of intracellular sulfur